MVNEMRIKIDEFLEKHDRIELNAEELEKVNGGITEYFHGLCLAADGIRDAFGMDVAVAWIRNYVIMSLEAVDWFKEGGGEYMFRRLETREKNQWWVKKN